MSKLQFVGDLGLWIGLIVAVAAAALAWRVYRREVTRVGTDPRLRWVLPLLRGGAVFMLMMMLTGPVLLHRELVGQVARVLVFTDASKSMSLSDEHMEPGRKLRIVERAGWLPRGKVDASLIEAADRLSESRRELGRAIGFTSRTELKKGAETFAASMRAAHDVLAKVGESNLVNVPPATGRVSRQMWTGAAVNSHDEKAVEAAVANAPAVNDTLESFASPQNVGDNYLQRIQGRVHPPITGEYVFDLSSDDQSALYLSTDDSSERRQRLITGGASGKIRLEAGRAYYIEALHTEGGGGDFVTVGWQRPDGKQERPIPGEFLSPMDASADADALLARMRKQIIEPANELARKPLASADDQEVEQFRRSLSALGETAGAYETALRQAFDGVAERLLASKDADVERAFKRFDESTRWQRTQMILLDGEEPMLARLAKSHDVELIALDTAQGQRIWTPSADAQTPQALGLEPQAPATDLATPLRSRLAADKPGREAERDGKPDAPDADKAEQRSAAVIIADGRHNDGPSPLEVARVLGDRNVPIYTIAVGSAAPAKDLAVLEVESPQIVYKDDRVRGRVLIADHLPAGTPFTLRIVHGEQTLWSQQLNTADLARRYVDYDFAIDKLVERELDAADADLTIRSLALEMKAVIDPVEGEQRDDNNAAPLTFAAATQRRKLLIIDGRPRWETRYIRNLFDRDERWEVNTIFVGPSAEHQQLRRGEGDGFYPESAQALEAYDLVVLGEVPSDTFRSDELVELARLVTDRAAGLIILDGERGHLRSYRGTPLADAIPVDWPEGERVASVTLPDALRLTDDGRKLAALQFASDAVANDELWTKLPGPRRVITAVALPGTETLAEAVKDQQASPVLVFRHFGAGKVIYSASDEFWRWRYNVADLYHQRLWHQIANWVMEEPYSVADRFVSLDVGGPVYRPGDRVRLRARLRDANGKPIPHATVQGVIWKGDKRVATVTLDAAEAANGAFAALSEPLEPGDYRVTVEVTGFTPDQIKANARFTVRPPDSGELAYLAANIDLLRDMAEDSGGRFLLEEQADRLPELLEPLSAGEIITSETALWQSYWWFVPMIGLLGAEWWIRKRAGMI